MRARARTDVFGSKQLYALILLENAGTDLEAYKLKTWKEAASVFAQATVALAAAERARDFEVRVSLSLSVCVHGWLDAAPSSGC